MSPFYNFLKAGDFIRFVLVFELKFEFEVRLVDKPDFFIHLLFQMFYLIVSIIYYRWRRKMEDEYV